MHMIKQVLKSCPSQGSRRLKADLMKLWGEAWASALVAASPYKVSGGAVFLLWFRICISSLHYFAIS